MNGRILVVDDDAAFSALVRDGLKRRGHEVHTASGAAPAMDILREHDVDLVLTDLRMPGEGGLALCRRMLELRPDVLVIVMTAFGDLEAAVAAMRAGAYDFLAKPFEPVQLELAVERALGHRALGRELTRLRTEQGRPRGQTLLGDSPAMRHVIELIDRVCGTDAQVLLTGESGSGKEVVARLIHERSRRAKGPFLAVNCAAMPEALLESELFGHVRGAFTDARQARTGLFVQAQGGTLFLDEIGELPLALQPKLLRALQERKVRPVGGDAEVPFDARIITATNRDLEEMVAQRLFRDDLYYRINVVHVALPPLRARGNDVLSLAAHFVDRFARAFARPVKGISAPVAERLLAYPWPGNVRELSNCIERAVALARFDELTVEDLPERLRSAPVAPATEPEIVSLEEMERRHILRVLEATGKSRTLAAQLLGIDRKTLYRKLKAWGLGSTGEGEDAA